MDYSHDGEAVREIVPKDSGAKRQLDGKRIAAYFLKAIVLLALLSLLAYFAPQLPTLALPFAFLIYAIPATIGSMFNVVNERIHKQDLYNSQGKLSHFNRRWPWWFAGFFVLYLVSSATFVLQAPSWDGAEWALIWAAIIVYFIVFLIVRHFCKKEFSAKYFKARAIKWSIVAAAIVLAILYAVISSLPSAEVGMNIEEILNGRYMPFSESPCALLAEADKFYSYLNTLTGYGFAQISTKGLAFAIIIKFILGFSVFVGVISQLGSCLLTAQEVKEEFQLLPADGKNEEKLLWRYFGILAIVWIVLTGAFLIANNFAAEARHADEYTKVDELLDETTDAIAIIAEMPLGEAVEKIKSVNDAESFEAELKKSIEALTGDEVPKATESINAYYDACAANLDAYMDWYDSIPGQAARALPVFGEQIVSDEFDKQVIDPVDKEGVVEQYSSFLDGLEGIYSEYQSILKKLKLSLALLGVDFNKLLIAENIPSAPQLWVPWDSEEGKEILRKDFLGQGLEEGAPDAKERILGYIESQRQSTLELVEGLPNKIFSDVENS